MEAPIHRKSSVLLGKNISTQKMPIEARYCGLVATSCIHVHLANTGSWFTKLIQLKLATFSAE